MNYNVIKENELFLLTDKAGDIPIENHSGYGLFMQDTRFLSRMEMYINGRKPVLLTSNDDKNYTATCLLTNQHMEENGNIILWREVVLIERKQFIYDGVMYEQTIFYNHSPEPVKFNFSVCFAADFSDMFVVRGFQHGKVGQLTDVTFTSRHLEISYLGRDRLTRRTKISWDRDAEVTEGGEVLLSLELNPRESSEITFSIVPMAADKCATPIPVMEALPKIKESYTKWLEQITQVDSDNESFNQLYRRSAQDLRVLMTDFGYGMIPVAGIPWFAVPFGRDSIITALQMLPFHPEIARRTLITMAAYQGKKEDPWRDEQPGKIMHELRFGELANTNQVPFAPYYGSIDSTPLFLLLLAEYVQWTNDFTTVTQLMPQIEMALMWLDRYGDRDGDGFMEYYRESAKGISNQGWKDSGDSIIHAHGEFAQAPIALVEVQGYVYQAKRKLAPILRCVGKEELAAILEQNAEQLKVKVNEKFWMPDESYYAIALDHKKQQVNSITSNPSHLLMTGIVDQSRADLLVERLMQPDMFSGYGLRTMSTQSAGYNPISYHNGSVWPHDNSLCLFGLSKMGYKEEAACLINGLIKAAHSFEHLRLPELFCGFDVEFGEPVPYPVACSPQAWAAGTPLAILQTMLGLWPNALEKKIYIDPFLPKGINRLQVKNLRIAAGTLELLVMRVEENMELEVFENTTGFQLIYPGGK